MSIYLVAWTLFIAIFGVELLLLTLKPVCVWLADWAQQGLVQRVLATAGIAAMTAGLYWMRQKRTLNYATMEIGFGIAIAWYILGQTLSPLAAMAGLLSAAFVMIRGIDNVARAWDDQRKSWEKIFEAKQRFVEFLRGRADIVEALRSNPEFVTQIVAKAVRNKQKFLEDVVAELESAPANVPTVAVLQARVASPANEPKSVGVSSLIKTHPLKRH